MQLLATILCSLVLHCWGKLVTEKFTSNVRQDEVIYTSVIIPSNAYFVNISVWSLEREIPPYVLLRYNGVPTIENYDVMYQLPAFPEVILLEDNNPSSSTLFIGLWGGSLLHSYRYFAGVETDMIVGVNSMIYSCDNDYQRTQDCMSIDILPFSANGKSTNINILADTSESYGITIPSGMESLNILFTPSIDENSFNNICKVSNVNNLNATVTLFRNHESEEVDSGIVRHSFHIPTLCSDTYASSNRLMQNTSSIKLYLKSPLPGTWIMKVYLSLGSHTLGPPSKSKRIHIQASNPLRQSIKSVAGAPVLNRTRDHAYDISLNFEVDIKSNICPSEFTSSNLDNSCSTPINPLVSLTSSYSSPRGYYTLTAEDKDNSVAYLRDDQKYVIFNGNLKFSQFAPIGGGFELLLQLYPVIESSAITDGADLAQYITEFVSKSSLLISVRCGGTPLYIDSTILALGSDYIDAIHGSSWLILPTDSLLLTSSNSKISYPIETTGSEGNETVLPGAQYLWTIMKPRLDGLDMSDSLYVQVALLDNNINIFKERVKFRADVTVMFVPCPTDACLHGTCILQEGDVSISSCQCKYPWAGERCDQLGVSDKLYLVQIVLLASSNMAMIPAIAYCAYNHMPFIGSILTSSAVASAFYHLCDTDVYCTFDLSFDSLHIFDVLFSLISIAAVTLSYGAWDVHSDLYCSIVMIITAILISPVSTNPTAPSIIVGTIAVSIAIAAASWIIAFHYYKCFKYKYRKMSTTEAVADEDHIEMESFASSHVNLDAIVDINQLRWIETPVSTTVDISSHSLYQRALVRVSMLRYTIIGLLLGAVGTLAFYLQNRTNYWYVHSIWHGSIMLSAYFILIGKPYFIAFLDKSIPK
jgi:hypothetical protein